MKAGAQKALNTLLASLKPPRLPALVCLLFPVMSTLADGLPMQFDRLSLEDGLSQSAVLTILQDSVGFMWFGTEDGLNRYDGHTFRHYNHKRSDADSLANDFIQVIVEDPDGNLWIATDGGGIAKWDRAANRFMALRYEAANPNSLAGNSVRALARDADGMLWIGTRRNGLDRLDPRTGTITHFLHDPAEPTSISSDSVYVVYVDTSRQLWVGTNGGLNRWDADTETFVRYEHDANDPRSISHNSIRAIFQDHAGVLWVGTLRGGLNRLHRETGDFTRYTHDPDDSSSLSHDWVRAILEDRKRRLWIGTAGGLNLLQRETGTFTRYVHDPVDPFSLADDSIMSLFQDRGGIMWIGTKSGGLSKWNPRSWSLGHHRAGEGAQTRLTSSNVSAFAQDDTGTLWVGTFGGGLNAIDRTTGAVTSYESHLDDGKVMALLFDSRRHLWIGTMNDGLSRLDPATGAIRSFRYDPADPDSLSADGIMSLFEDRLGNIWVGTFGGGISRWDSGTGRFSRFLPDATDPFSLSSPRVTSFAEDESGAIWIGTDGGGLNLLDPETGRFQHFRHDVNEPRSLSADTIYSLHVRPSGTLYVGTRGGGLDRVVGTAREPEKIHFKNFSHADGLTNDVIYGILSDDDGNLWLSTNAGLTRFNPMTGEATSFHRSHGLQGEEFNFGAYFRSREGELFFGGANGFNAFFPRQLEVNNHPPPVVLTSFAKFNVPVDTPVPHSLLREIELEFQDDVVTFEFAALDYTAPAENRYAYMLEGFDAGWVSSGNVRRVTYTNLDAGDYVFKIRAANSDGVWNETGMNLALSVAPAPWATWWAYLLYTATAILLIAAAWRSQQRKLVREVEYSERLKEEVHQRTQELADSNAELQSANNKLLEASLTDPLTGLQNRRFLFEVVSNDIELVQRRHYQSAHGPSTAEPVDLAFMMIDLDHFKPINDNFGHPVGDQVLLEICNILRQACRASDFVIRWGGDEFLVIARHTDRAETEALAERIRTQVSAATFELRRGYEARTTCSIGYACYPFASSQPDLLSWEQVLGLADSAMYEAKTKRDAWVGFLSTASSGEDQSLYHDIRQSPERVQEAGMLQIRSSIVASQEVA